MRSTRGVRSRRRAPRDVTSSRRDPVKTLEVLRLDGASYRLIATYHDGVAVRAEPFDAIELDLSVLWAR